MTVPRAGADRAPWTRAETRRSRKIRLPDVWAIRGAWQAAQADQETGDTFDTREAARYRVHPTTIREIRLRQSWFWR